jgi:hypothetical protein
MKSQLAASLMLVLLTLLAWDVAGPGWFGGVPRAMGAPSDTSAETSGDAGEPVATDIPQAVAVEASTLDAGVVRRGETAHYQFTLRNLKTIPLEITVKPACGCTLTKYDQRIAPGDSGKIEAELRTRGLSGRVTKSIDVLTNDSDQPKLQLKLTADVREPIQAKLPPGKTFYPARGETSVERFRVQVDSNEPLNILSASTSATYVRAGVRKAASEADDFRGYEVELEFSPDTPAGRSSFALFLATDCPENPTHLISLFCEKGIIVTPQRITFASARANAEGKVSQTCLLRTKQGPLNILDLRSSDPRVRATARPLPNGTHQILSVTYDGGGSPGIHQGTLQVKTDDPDQPLLEIPFGYTSR